MKMNEDPYYKQIISYFLFLNIEKQLHVFLSQTQWQISQ